MAAPIAYIGTGLHFDLEVDIGNRVLRPHGDLDARTSPLLRAAAAAVAAQVPGDLTIDLRHVDLADPALLAVLIELRMVLRANCRQLILVNRPPSVLSLIMAAGLRAVLS